MACHKSKFGVQHYENPKLYTKVKAKVDFKVGFAMDNENLDAYIHHQATGDCLTAKQSSCSSHIKKRYTQRHA